MPELTWLNLDKTTITDAGIASLVPLQKLEWMHLGSNDLTDASVESLAQLKGLKQLILTFNPGITADGQAKLQEALPNCKIEF